MNTRYGVTLLAATAALACSDATGPMPDPPVGSDNVITESRTVSGFHAISVSGVAKVVIEHTGEETLTITAEDNIMPLVSSTVIDGTLHLGVEVDVRTRHLQYHITVKDLDAIEASGVLAVDIDGVKTETFAIDVLGVSNVTVRGVADHQRLTVSGVSSYDADELESRVVIAHVSGVSGAIVRVSDRLEATVQGPSRLVYIGDPEVINNGDPGKVRKQ